MFAKRFLSEHRSPQEFYTLALRSKTYCLKSVCGEQGITVALLLDPSIPKEEVTPSVQPIYRLSKDGVNG